MYRRPFPDDKFCSSLILATSAWNKFVTCTYKKTYALLLCSKIYCVPFGRVIRGWKWVASIGHFVIASVLRLKGVGGQTESLLNVLSVNYKSKRSVSG